MELRSYLRGTAFNGFAVWLLDQVNDPGLGSLGRVNLAFDKDGNRNWGAEELYSAVHVYLGDPKEALTEEAMYLLEALLNQSY